MLKHAPRLSAPSLPPHHSGSCLLGVHVVFTHPSTPSLTSHDAHAGRSSTIAPAITDIVASATHNCPDTYEVVRMNGNGNSNLYAASPVDTDMFLCIQRMSPERAEGQTRIGDSTNGRGSNAPQTLINNLETTRRIKPNNHHRVEKAIEHFVERSEAQVRSLTRSLAPSPPPPDMFSPPLPTACDTCPSRRAPRATRICTGKRARLEGSPGWEGLWPARWRLRGRPSTSRTRCMSRSPTLARLCTP